MNFGEFAIMASRALRHDLINALFVVQAHIDLLDNIDPEELNIIRVQTRKVLSIMEVWKELEELGEDSSWQGLKTLLLRVKTQMGNPHLEINVRDNLKINTNGLFQFVFRNLIDNSMRHGVNPDIVMSVSTKIEDSNLIIIYEDNGIGIPASNKSRIFAQGFGDHTGLGMFFARQIIEFMGGTIVENGVLGRGARFEIKLPKDSYRITNCDL